MSIAMLLGWILGLPGLALSGLLGPGMVMQTPAVTASPKPAISATPRPSTVVRPSASPSASPRPSSSPSAGAAAGLGAVEIASEATCPGQSDVSKTAQALTCLTANARAYHGLPVVSADAALMAAAAAKDQDMLACGYGHTACGREFGYWIKAKGYAGRCYGENIAMGQRTPREVFVAWMNSEGHRANILNRDYRDIGVAELAGKTGPLWTMELGGCR